MNNASDNQNYFYDVHHVRYELYQASGGKPYNWVFLPGGPGADSSYFKSLIDNLSLPGNVWLIDLPGNGSNNAFEPRVKRRIYRKFSKMGKTTHLGR